MIDCTMLVARDGSIWEQPHWMEAQSLDGPEQKHRVVEIRDGTEEVRPMIFYVMPDRPNS